MLLALSIPLALATERLTDPVRPVDQVIDVTLDPAADTFGGRVAITLEVLEPVASFSLHGEDLAVSGGSLRPEGRNKVLPVEVEAEGNRLRVRAGKALKPGLYSLELRYEAPIHAQAYGVYAFEHGDRPYVVSQLEADDARTAWPCFDEPTHKIPWRFVVRHPTDAVAISNTPVESTVPLGDLVQTTFAWSKPIPSYALALAVGPYAGTPVEGMSVPGTVWTVAGKQPLAAALVQELPPILAYLEGWFDARYPYEKLDFVAVPEFAFGGMENPGAVVLHERFLVDPSRDTPEAREGLRSVTAHEVAHMWFGDLVTLAWWDDFWLNESFATWSASDAMEALAPEYREEMNRVSTRISMIRSDGAATARPVRTEVDPAAIFETTNFAAYPKGEAVLEMMRAWIGPEAFQQGLKRYLEAHAWGNASAADLFAALEAASGQPVGEVLAGYLDAPGAPAVSLERDGAAWKVRQRRYARLGAEVEGGPWTVPLRLRVGRPDGSVEVIQHLLEGAEATLDLGEVAWVHPAADGVGYYAWSLDAGSEAALLGALGALSPAERRDVVGSLSLQVEAGERDVGEVLDAMGAFSAETDPVVISAVLGALDLVGVAADLDDQALEATMNGWRRERLRPLLEAVGEPLEGEPIETRDLRRSLLSRLADAGDEAVRARATALGQAFLDDPSSVDFRLGRWGLDIVVEDGDAALREQLLAKAERATDQRLRSALLSASSGIPGDEVRDAVLARMLDPETPTSDLFPLWGGLSLTRDSDADDDFMLAWMMEHYERLVAKLPPQGRMRLASSGGGCDLERFERSRAFFSDPARIGPGVDRVLAETEERVRRCLLRRETHGPSVRAYLEAWAAR